MAKLDLHHIQKQFGSTRVLQDISLSVSDGAFIVLLGPSGCGKSTLLRIIAGLDVQTAGSVLIDGKPIDHVAPRDRDMAMVFQQYALYPHLTVRENLAFGLTMRKEPATVIQTRIKEAVDLLEIHPLLDRLPKELSGGQRQRVAMGRAIVRKPKLFLFDEPLSNLDARLRGTMRIELQKLHKRLGITMVYVTHDQIEAMTLGETIVIMDHGNILQVGSSEEIYRQPNTPFVAGFIGHPPMNLLEGNVTTDQQTCYFHTGNLRITLPIHSCPPTLTSAVLGIRPEDIHLTSSETPEITISGTVECIENLGADLFMYVLAQEQRIVLRTAPGQHKQPGEAITIHVPRNRLHLFIDGQRIERNQTP
ncbi:MAG: sn-glycerol-3-phosphate ABC transporter ATP-binding protein UgpC [Nitrospirales bacterium]|nr:sn-glycerol-3-phosphate ABC transporter ATP-binding protein UgpC [Nitrospirales bacterium]